MNISVTGRNIDVTPPLREYVESKLDRIRRHFEHLIDVQFVLDVDKLVHHVEATIHTRGKDLFAENNDQDMYAAIDGLIDKLDRQLIKHKEKLQSRNRAQARKVNAR